MPLIQVKLIESVLTPAQKSQIVTKLTDDMVPIEGENMRPVTSVAIEEVRSGEWGIGGQAVITDDAKATFASFLVFGCF
jgi:4-oxalocrotonate tautomerase